MKRSRDPQCLGDTEIAGYGMQASPLIEFEILAGVEHVEASAPESNSRSQQQYSRIERAAHGNPGRRGGDPHGEPQDQMRPASETLGIGIEKNYGQRERR